MDYGVFNVRTDVNVCNCTRRCTDTIRESALKAVSGRKIPCRTRESNLRRQRARPMLYQLSYIPTLVARAVVINNSLLQYRWQNSPKLYCTDRGSSWSGQSGVKMTVSVDQSVQLPAGSTAVWWRIEDVWYPRRFRVSLRVKHEISGL